MKKSLIVLLAFCFCLHGIAQVKDSKKSDKILKEYADNGCKCVDSINTYNKTKEEIAIALNRCIDAQAGAYQLSSKLMNIDLSDTAMKAGGKRKEDN
ncbi:MAG: hypothetical protein PHR83_03560 [Paludibacter sp.]|nr:hypothetical protein [Paludibacter sp.]